MRLRSIELAGFKSFQNRTALKFEPGVTGIVGPNGCGKSNVVDAIKWVLGTLSYKAMRAEEMMDVIFKGAEGVPASNFAEVRLTFDNADRRMPIEANEVCIGRKLHRDGNSEYFLNGQPCRLRDIRELFYGTGIGADTYSIIEQGKIDRLVMSTPKDRRVVFDEAAGISKYRARKKEAEQKLQHVEQDLLRLADVSKEVTHELHSLRTQAGKAARYRELKDELKTKTLALLYFEREAIDAAEKAAREKLEAATAERDALQAKVAEANRARSEAGARRLSVEKDAERARTELETLDQRAAQAAETVETAKKRLEEIEADVRTLDDRRLSTEAELADIRAKAAEAAGAIDETQASRAQAEAAVGDFTARLEQARRAAEELAAAIDAARADLVELARKESTYRNERLMVERDQERLVARRGQIAARRADAQKALQQLAALVAEQDETLARLAATLDERRREKADVDAGLDRTRAELSEIRTELQVVAGERDRMAARLDTLRELEAHREGVAAGARTLLEKFEGALGTVADLLEVPIENAPAVEAALGERAGYVVVRDEDALMRAAEIARAHKSDRTGIVALTGPEAPGGGAADLVKPAPGAENLVRRLLGGIQISDVALPSGQPVVTRAGELRTPDGAIVISGGERTGLITRRAEIRELTTKVETLSADAARRSERLDALQADEQNLMQRLEALRAAVYDLTVGEHETKKEREGTERRRALSQGEFDAAVAEDAAIDREAEELTARHARTSSLETEAARRQQESQKGLDAKVADQRATEQARSGIETSLAAAKADRAKFDEKLSALAKAADELASREASQAAALQKIEADEQELKRRADEAKAACESAEKTRTELEARRGELLATVEAASAAVAEVEAAIARATAICAEVDGVLTQKDDEIRSSELAVHEQGVHREHLARRLSEEFQLTPDAVTAPTEPVDRDALAAAVEEVKAKIARFGPVNEAALDRLKEVEERATFLAQQEKDLLESRDKLKELIGRLNREAGEHFEQTMTKVREHFDAIFRKVFNGGKTDIVVHREEGVDPMDWGVEIMARPPKKELTSLSLLSGGEKSLTAISLVMAFFQVNPSPFCILDEADAALDEGNVGRYSALVQEMVKTTQFIVITHNKRTMAAADALYGVCMERAGVTKLVSVNFNKAAEMVQAAPA